MSEAKKGELVPRLRFPEFRDAGEWKEDNLINYCQISTGGKNLQDAEKDGCYPFFVRSQKIERINSYSYDGEAILIPGDGKVGEIYHYINGRFDYHQRVYKLSNFEGIKGKFVYFYLSEFFRKQAKTHSARATVDSLRMSVFTEMKIRMPSLKEQQKIADCLSSFDELISIQSQKVELLKTYKKGLMQQLFPKEGETTPQLRFPEFRDAGEWEQKKLGDFLDHIQPTKYLVQDTRYHDNYETPVLTAGKTFILGHTNEQDGIFSDSLPVIIFDDFTTSTKYVDFPFKVKSSALKILLAKENSNSKFVYELMQMIKYEVGVHKRHWLSVFSKLDVVAPNLKEQQKIADCLSSFDELISVQSQKVELLKIYKKGLMQQLFPSPDGVCV